MGSGQWVWPYPAQLCQEIARTNRQNRVGAIVDGIYPVRQPSSASDGSQCCSGFDSRVLKAVQHLAMGTWTDGNRLNQDLLFSGRPNHYIVVDVQGMGPRIATPSSGAE